MACCDVMYCGQVVASKRAVRCALIADRNGGMELHVNSPHAVMYMDGSMATMIKNKAAPNVADEAWSVVAVSDVLRWAAAQMYCSTLACSLLAASTVHR